MKIGRNDPCPCGSGKKYKKCCLPKKTDSPEAVEYRRLSKVLDPLLRNLIEYGFEVFGRKVFALAFPEFFGWPEEDEAPDDEAVDRMDTLFWPWFVFNWEYDKLEDEDHLVADGPEGRTVAELYLEAGRVSSRSAEGKLIQAANRVPYSFFEVLAIDPGRSVRLRDVLTGGETTVREHVGSMMLEAESVLFGRVIRVGAVGMFLGLGQNLLPPAVKPELIELRRFLGKGSGPLTDRVLNEWDVEIRRTFIGIDHRLHALPRLQNTDGEALEFHKLVYDIDSPEEAVEKLAPLSQNETVAEIRADAETDTGGHLRKATIHWSRKGGGKPAGLPDTVLGTIEIDGGRMTVSVSSAERARRIRREIDRRMGDAARFRLDEIQHPDATMERPGPPGGDMPVSEPELMQHPEIRAALHQMLKAHWGGWVDQKLPALGGRTPRQAVRTEDGREAVAALLLDAQKSCESDPARAAIEAPLIAGVRRRLKLDKPLAQRESSGRSEKRAEQVRHIRSLIQAFGEVRLHESYTGYALDLCDVIAGSDDLNLHRGRVEIWAAAIVYAIARLNFLFSKEMENRLRVEELCACFGVKKQTAANKASLIAETLELSYDDRRFCGPHVAEIFNRVEDAQGFIRPAVPPDELPAAPPLKPSPWAPPKEKAAEAPAATPQAPKKEEASRQLSLFDE